jgi:hypothetical protein
MNPRIIDVLLTTLGEDWDILRFIFEEDYYIDIDLNSATGQSEIKKLFAELLKIAIDVDIELSFSSEKDFPRGLYKEVCEEYIKDISRELKTCALALRQG